MKANKFISKKNDLSFELYKNNFTAQIIDSSNAIGDIIIPRSIIQGSNEYIITSIGEGSFRNSKFIKSIRFSKDSQLQTIRKNAFSRSSIESLTIPSTVNNLEPGWCSHTWDLTSVTFSSSESTFKYLDKERKMIIFKDVLVFACRDISGMFLSHQI